MKKRKFVIALVGMGLLGSVLCTSCSSSRNKKYGCPERISAPVKLF